MPGDLQTLPARGPLVDRQGNIELPWLLVFGRIAGQSSDAGDVVGPGSSTTGAIAIFASTDGRTLAELVAGAGSLLLGRGSSGAGIYQAITLGSGLTMTGTVLSASGSGGTVTTTGTPSTGDVAAFSGATSITNAPQTGSGNVVRASGPTMDAPTVSTSLTLSEAVNVILGTVTGSQIGSAPTQKLAFFGAAPVVQPATTGTTTGFTAGSGTPVLDDSTFTGATGSAAYTIGDVVLALKQAGLLAA